MQTELQKMLNTLENLSDDIYLDISDKEEDSPTTNEVDRALQKVVSLDLSCRLSLWPLQSVVEQIELPQNAFANFEHLSKKLLNVLHPVLKPETEMHAAHQSITLFLTSPDQFTLQIMFTTISVLIVLASLCIGELSYAQQVDVIHLLDDLLLEKLDQLKLLNIMVLHETSSDRES